LGLNKNISYIISNVFSPAVTGPTTDQIPTQTAHSVKVTAGVQGKII